MELIMQPTFSTCGQACIAMIAGKSVEEDEAYNEAQKLLIEHRDKLDTIAQILLEKEKINEQEFKKIFE